AKNMKDNAWFVGFAPRSAPEIVVVALFEHGEHGQFAAPIVRDVLKAYFDKKQRLAEEARQKQTAMDKLASLGNALRPELQGPVPRGRGPAANAVPSASDAVIFQSTVPDTPQPVVAPSKMIDGNQPPVPSPQPPNPAFPRKIADNRPPAP